MGADLSHEVHGGPVSGFSISNNLLANDVNLELSEHQQALGTSVRDLSSGLRVNDAADDPSGYAIASSLQTHAQAFDQASQNVSEAQNAATVADGALAAVTDILLRIRELAVGAASSVDSTADREDIQAEIGQLLGEINRIAQDTNFNGRSLLDGSIAGNQPAQSVQVVVEANSVLLSSAANTASNSPSSFLLQSAQLYTSAVPPQISFGIAQDVTASPLPQTVQVDSTQDIVAGQQYSVNGGVVTVESVDAANDTITGIFSKDVGKGDQASTIWGANIVGAVSAGTQIATLTNPEPLYAGEILQVDYNSFATNDLIVVQQVLSSVSFVANFSKPHAANAPIFSDNGTGLPNPTGGEFNLSFSPGVTDGAPVGTTAYVIETTGSGPNTVTTIAGTGVVVGGSVSDSLIAFPKPISAPGGSLEIIELVGEGSTPIVNSVDGTIKLTVVNQSGTVGVQESFYDTATQTSVTSPYLIQPGQSAMLYDGVVTTLGHFSEADVGSTAYIKVLQSVAASSSANRPALAVQSGSDEGDIVQIGIPAVNTNTLRISATTVIGASGSDPTLASEDAIGQMDYALQQVTTIRAQLGASIVRLGIDQSNDDTAATELTASQSNITDLDVGSATTEFTAQQVEIEVTTSMLQQVNSLPDEVLKLFAQQNPS